MTSGQVDLEYIRTLGLSETDLELLEDLDPISQKLRWKTHSHPRDAVHFLHDIGMEKREKLKTQLNQEINQKVEQYSQECRQIMASWKRAQPTLGYSEDSKYSLPLDVWSRILDHLCDDTKLNDIRGPSVVARDLCNASKTSKDLYAASLPAFQRLSSLCAENVLERHWQCLLSDPWNSELLSDKDLATLLKRVGVREFGSREVKVTLLYKAVKQTQPIRLPAKLILSVQAEKKYISKHLSEATRLKALSATRKSDFHYRAKLTQLGIPSLHVLQELYKLSETYETCKRQAQSAQSMLKYCCQRVGETEKAALRAKEEKSKAEEESSKAEEAKSKALDVLHGMGFDAESVKPVEKPGRMAARKSTGGALKDLNTVSSRSFSTLLRRYDMLNHANSEAEREIQ